MTVENWTGGDGIELPAKPEALFGGQVVGSGEAPSVDVSTPSAEPAPAQVAPSPADQVVTLQADIAKEEAEIADELSTSNAVPAAVAPSAPTVSTAPAPSV